MEDIGLFKEGLKWVRSQKHVFLSTQASICSTRERIAAMVDCHGPVLYSGCLHLWKMLFLVLREWKSCITRGMGSLLSLGSTTFFVILWCCFLSLTSTSCIVYVFLVLGAAAAAVRFLGYTPGLFLVGFFGILILWMYGNFWVTGSLFLIGAYLFSMSHTRLVIVMSTVYAVYCAQIRVGWFGVFLAINLAFVSDDLLNYLLQGYENANQNTEFEEPTKPTVSMEDFSCDSEYSAPSGDGEEFSSPQSSSKMSYSPPNSVKVQRDSAASKVVIADSGSLDEMRRIMNSSDHYQALGLYRNKNVDVPLLKKIYRKKAMLVHPDKNMGNPMASESFKKLQCAYEIISDATKRKNYDEQLRKEESSSARQRSHGTSQQDGVEYRSEESRRIHCTKCGNSHIWICTNRTKYRARWCQECSQYHQAKDGDGWVEDGLPIYFGMAKKVDIPRAFACAESKIFDVSEWAICQGMSCRPNTHRPTFHVNTSTLGKGVHHHQKPRESGGFTSWNLDAEMMGDEDEAEFELWLQQAFAAGLFSEPSSIKRRKIWTPFKIHQKKSKKQWRKML
ncbi:hypothetical protein AMTRI_Chr02g254910 [Amborella trichopoda]